MGTHAGKYEWAGGAAGGSGGGEDCSLWIRSASLQLDDGLWQCQVTASSYDAQVSTIYNGSAKILELNSIQNTFRMLYRVHQQLFL